MGRATSIVYGLAGQDGQPWVYLANPSSGNRYAYVADDPANYIDPTGMFSLSNFLFGVVASYFTTTICFAVSAAAAPETLGLSLGIATACGVGTQILAGAFAS
ncbi:MAG: hypothetical protein JWM19_4941 [Actinomycetia bacterium]|nr:hypothetical protein [Actinomycetes bacterium]